MRAGVPCPVSSVGDGAGGVGGDGVVGVHDAAAAAGGAGGMLHCSTWLSCWRRGMKGVLNLGQKDQLRQTGVAPRITNNQRQTYKK